MTTPDPIDCEYQSHLVCPYCGHEDEDSWELTADSGETECASCSRTFRFEREVSINYSSEPIIGPHPLSGPYLDEDQNP